MTRGILAATVLAVLMAPPAPPARAAAGEELAPGLVGEYYALGEPIEDFPEIGAGRKPRFKRVDSQVDFDCADEHFGDTKLKEYFFVRWTGLIRVPRDGRYVFFTCSDDGSRLYVNNRMVVDNSGLHSMTEQSGEVELKSGDHPIRIDFFENSGQAGCVVSWRPPDEWKEVIPAGAFFHPKAKTPTEEERRGIARAAPEDGGGRDEEGPREVEAIPLIPVDERVVARGGPPPHLVGRVVGVFEDPPLLLLVVQRGSREIPVYADQNTRIAYVGIAREHRRPAAGHAAYVWFRRDAPDTAERLRFAPEKK